MLVLIPLMLLPACSDDGGPVSPASTVPPVFVKTPPEQVRTVPGVYMQWESQREFSLPKDSDSCAPAFAFLPNGVMAHNEAVSGTGCTQYTFGRFRIVPVSGSTAPEPLTVVATLTHGSSGSGTGCSSITLLSPWTVVLEECGVVAGGHYAIQLLTNTSYRIETNAAAHWMGHWYRSELRLNLAGSPPAVIPVALDILPGDEADAWNCRNTGGLLSVAVLSDDAFNALDIDAGSVRFGRTGAEAAEVHQRASGAQRHEEDANGDGRPDLIFHFASGETGFGCSDVPGGSGEQVVTTLLTGETAGGEAIQGTGSLRVRSPGRP